MSHKSWLGLARCVLCGGRGGWWSWSDLAPHTLEAAFRETCSYCSGSGWEPSEMVADLVGPIQAADRSDPWGSH